MQPRAVGPELRHVATADRDDGGRGEPRERAHGRCKASDGHRRKRLTTNRSTRRNHRDAVVAGGDQRIPRRCVRQLYGRTQAAARQDGRPSMDQVAHHHVPVCRHVGQLAVIPPPRRPCGRDRRVDQPVVVAVALDQVQPVVRALLDHVRDLDRVWRPRDRHHLPLRASQDALAAAVRMHRDQIASPADGDVQRVRRQLDRCRLGTVDADRVRGRPHPPAGKHGDARRAVRHLQPFRPRLERMLRGVGVDADRLPGFRAGIQRDRRGQEDRHPQRQHQRHPPAPAVCGRRWQRVQRRLPRRLGRRCPGRAQGALELLLKLVRHLPPPGSRAAPRAPAPGVS